LGPNPPLRYSAITKPRYAPLEQSHTEMLAKPQPWTLRSSG
jgi:hypothetical protein